MDTAFGHQVQLFVAVGAKVVSTRNLHQEVGHATGFRGEMVDIVYARKYQRKLYRYASLLSLMAIG